MKCSQITVPEVNLCFHNYIQQGDLIVCFHALAVRTNLVFQFEKKKVLNYNIQAKCSTEYFKRPISITLPGIKLNMHLLYLLFYCKVVRNKHRKAWILCSCKLAWDKKSTEFSLCNTYVIAQCSQIPRPLGAGKA